MKSTVLHFQSLIEMILLISIMSQDWFLVHIPFKNMYKIKGDFPHIPYLPIP